MKTSELIDQALDWAVAKALGVPVEVTASSPPVVRLTNHRDMFEVGARSWAFTPTTHWAQGGPIVEREIGNLWKHNKLDPNEPDVWTAAAYHKAPDGTMLYYEDGPTPLIAALRCYVASTLGDEVDVPEELVIIPPPSINP